MDGNSLGIVTVLVLRHGRIFLNIFMIKGPLGYPHLLCGALMWNQCHKWPTIMRASDFKWSGNNVSEGL